MGLPCTKLFSDELMVGSAPEQGQTERKKGLRPHAGPMQPICGNWDLTPDQIPVGLLLNLLVGAAAICGRCSICPGPATRQCLLEEQLFGVCSCSLSGRAARPNYND